MADRLWEVDLARGIALGLMLVFNWSYALADLDVYTILPRDEWLYWTVFARFIGSLFIFIAGVALTLSVNRLRKTRPEDWAAVANWKYPARGLRLLGIGLLITIVTYWYDPDRFVYFGILHCIGVAILLARPLLTSKRGAILAALGAFALTPVVGSVETGSRVVAAIGFDSPYPSIDYFPVIPYVGVAFLGIWAGHTAFPRGRRRFGVGDRPSTAPLSTVVRTLQVVGQRTLVIYLLHQPALLAVLMVFGVDVF